MAQEATIRRGVRNARYAAIPNHVFEDSRLSMEARWLLGYLLSKPDNWTVVIGDIIKKGNCGRDKARKMIAELVEFGYAEREQSREEGKFGSSILVIYDEPSAASVGIHSEISASSGSVAFLPQTDLPATAKPAPVLPSPVKSAPSNNSDLTITENQQREGAREIEDEEGDPKSLHKRYRALEIGKSNNPWPGVLSSGGDWGFRHFTNLTPEERLRAEDRRDAYLAACPKIGGGKRKGEPDAPPLGVYLRDKRFDLVDAIVPKPVKSARPELIPVAPFGPIWGGLRAMALLGGVEAFDIPLDLRDGVVPVFETLRKTSEATAMAYLQRKGISLAADGEFIFPEDFEREEIKRRQRDSGYPEVNRLHRQAKAGEGGSTEAKYAIFSELCEPVPVASELFQVWKAHDEERGWPVVPDPGRQRVVYFPKGGPDGLAEFHRAALSAGTSKGRDDEHAA